MMDQLLHVLQEHVIVVVAITVVEYYMMQTFYRGFEGLFAQLGPIATLTGVTDFIVAWPFRLLPTRDLIRYLERTIFLLTMEF